MSSDYTLQSFSEQQRIGVLISHGFEQDEIVLFLYTITRNLENFFGVVADFRATKENSYVPVNSDRYRYQSFKRLIKEILPKLGQLVNSSSCHYFLNEKF